MTSNTVARPQFTRCHYQQIASVIQLRFSAEAPDEGGRWVVDAIANDLCDLFAGDNQRFDRDKFLSACGIDF
jgi:hypothetical protein